MSGDQGASADADRVLSPSATEPVPVSALSGDARSREGQPVSDPYTLELRNMLLASVGGYERFENSFNWRTFDPKKRAEAAVMDAVNVVEAGVADVAEAGGSPDLQREWLASAIKKWAAYQHAGARTMNWMITGPARFPVARNEKAMRVEAKRCDEYLAFAADAEGWTRRRLRAVDRREAVAADAASDAQHQEQRFGDVRVVLNKALDRVQVIFPDRPSEDERRILKGRAFRWAPSVGAWQRQLTRNGVWAAGQAMRDMGLTASDSDGNGEAGKTVGLDPKGDSAGGDAASPNQDHPPCK